LTVSKCQEGRFYLTSCQLKFATILHSLMQAGMIV